MRAYLLGHGWTLKSFARPQVLLFEGPSDDEGEPIVQWVPASEDLQDYERGVVDVITNLSVLEDRHPVEVLNDILQYSAAKPSPNPTAGNGTQDGVGSAAPGTSSA
jgi:hypothetical protein